MAASTFGNITLASGGIQKNKAVVAISKGDVVALNDSGDVILASNEYVEGNATTAYKAAGIAVADTSVGELCIYATKNAVITAAIDHPDQDHRWYLEKGGKVCNYEDLDDGDYISVVAIPDTSKERSRLVLDSPVTVKNPCWATSADVPTAPINGIATDETPQDSDPSELFATLKFIWLPSSGNACGPVKQRVYLSIGTDSPLVVQEFDDNTTATYTVIGQDFGETYRFSVAAVNYNGEGPRSTDAVITPIQP
jgi:hypothetical protein